MKSFIYTIKEHTPRNGHTVKTIRIYQVKNGIPEFVCTESDTFVNDHQLFLMTAEAEKLLPKRAFDRYPMGGYVMWPAQKLQEAGIAKVTQVA